MFSSRLYLASYTHCDRRSELLSRLCSGCCRASCGSFLRVRGRLLHLAFLGEMKGKSANQLHALQTSSDFSHSRISSGRDLLVAGQKNIYRAFHPPTPPTFFGGRRQENVFNVLRGGRLREPWFPASLSKHCRGNQQGTFLMLF